eukprot:s2020_g4.t1
MTAERKAWRLLALHMAKDQTLSIGAALEDIRNNSRFWSMEIDEFCLRKTHLPGPKGPRTKGKGKAQNKFAKQWDIGRGRGARAWKGKGDPGKSLDKGKPREEWPWASQGEEAAAPPPTPIENRIRSSQSHASDGKGFCKKYHAFNRCPEDCGRSHNCPVILPNEKKHRAVFDKPAPPLLGLSCADSRSVAGKLKKGTAGEWEQLVEMDICRDSKLHNVLDDSVFAGALANWLGLEHGFRRFSLRGRLLQTPIPQVDPLGAFQKSLQTDLMLVDAHGQTNGSFTCGPSWPIASHNYCVDLSPLRLLLASPLSSKSSKVEDPDKDFLEHLEEGVPLGVDGPTLQDPDIWPSKQELGGSWTKS